MKKRKCFLMIFMIVICMCISLSGCSNKKGKLEPITFKEYQELIENKKNFVLEVMSSDCTHCKSLKPKLQNVINEYELTVKTINLQNLSTEEYQEFTKIIGSKATPIIIFYKNGYEASVTTRILGDVTKDRIVQKFKDNGIIK